MKLSLSRKLSFALLIAFIASIVYAYVFSNMLYERLYVKNIESEMMETGRRLSDSYHNGPVSDEFAEQIRWFNTKSKFDALVVRNPRELSMCLPYETGYDSLISEQDREQLLKGETIYRKGYVPQLRRNVISYIVPLLDGKRLEGVIYLSYPLANLGELTARYTSYWMIGGLLFLVLAGTVGNRWLKHLIKPLVEMKSAAKQLSDGNLAVRVAENTEDEVGQLARTFNEMAESIQEEDEKRRDFLANVSHELRTPISYIKGYTEAIQMGMVKPEDMHKYQGIILREARRMERLVGDLLDLAKLESDVFTLEKAPLVLAQTIEETLEKIVHQASEKGIELETELDYEVIAEADEGRLEQMLANLLDNALRHTESGGSISVRLYKLDGRLTAISVEDTGAGIPSEDLASITQRFYRVQKARTRKEGGTGLGLPIVEMLAKLHNGALEIESELGKGTKATIILPYIK